MKRFFSYILAIILAWSCVYPLDIKTEEYSDETLVIDGSIVIGGQSTVSISKLMSIGTGYYYGPTEYVKDATVTVECDNGTVYKTEPAASMSSMYRYNYVINTAGAPGDRSYRLVVVRGGKTYASSWIKPLPAPKITDVQFTADDENVVVSLDADARGGGGFAAVQFDEIWKFHAQYVRIFELKPLEWTISTILEPDLTYYECWRKRVGTQEKLIDYSYQDGVITAFPFTIFSRTNERNQYEYNILVKIRNLPEQEYRYMKQLNDANNISLFSPEPGNTETNIVCESDASEKVFGYVSISKQDYYIAKLDGRYYIARAPNGLISVEADEEAYMYYYNAGFVPVNVMNNGSIGWGTERCYNCVTDGGTLDKPSFDVPNN